VRKMNIELKRPVEVGRMPKSEFDYERAMDTAYAIDWVIGRAVYLRSREENDEVVVEIVSYDTVGPILGELTKKEIKQARETFETSYNHEFRT